MSPAATEYGSAQDLALPSAVDAERVLLGAIMLDNHAWADVAAKLKPSDLFLDSHQRIGKAMKRLQDQGIAIDVVTLMNEMGRHNEIEAVGGASYLVSLTEGLPRRPAIADYIAIVKEKSVLRQTASLCQRTLNRALEQQDSPIEILSDLSSAVEKMAAPAQTDNRGPVANFIVQVADNLNEEYRSRISPTIPSGNDWFDRKTGGGYRMGKITIVAARPKVGKSAWATSSIAHNCLKGRKVVDFTLEMDKDERTRNLVPYVVPLRNRTVNRPAEQTPEQNALVNHGLGLLADWPYFCYDGEMDIDQVCWTIDRETRKDEEVLFVIDHFGLMTSSEKDIRKRYVENSSRLRKKIAQKKNCALLALFQLNPVPREYADKRPIPDDLKESKNPIEDCFAMVLLHRYIDKESLRMTTKANINLALLRGGGSAGNIDCEFDRAKLAFDAAAVLDLDDDNE